MKIFIHRNGQVYGPYSENSIRSFLKDGLVSTKDWTWANGWSNWLTLKKFLEEVEFKQITPNVSDGELEKIQKIKKIIERGDEKVALDLLRDFNYKSLVLLFLGDCRINHETGRTSFPLWMKESISFFIELLKLVPSNLKNRLDPSISIKNLKRLTVPKSINIRNLDWLRHFSNLEILNLTDLGKLQCIKGLAYLKNLSKFTWAGPTNISCQESLRVFSHLHNLEVLALDGLHFVKKTDFLLGNSKLKSLKIYSLQLSQLTKLENLPNLKDLNLEGCEKIESINLIHHLQKLENINLSNCTGLENLNGINKLQHLKKLKLGGTNIAMEKCYPLLEYEKFNQLILPNGSGIQKYQDNKMCKSTFPSIEFSLQGSGLEAHEGNITMTQYEYWKDRTENELIQHCEWSERNIINTVDSEEVPENAHLDKWFEMNDISSVYGCQSGYLSVTETSKDVQGWQKKTYIYEIEDGFPKEESIEVIREKQNRLISNNPSFSGYRLETGIFCVEEVREETFKSSNLKVFTTPIFGGKSGNVVSRINYKGRELEFFPETKKESFFFEVNAPSHKSFNG